ncbi:uncharacterized protein LAESUDRAFT_717375 [Laetiporus sulphureus 93-53]|uniref:Uncharacterized protein n=1 Tax=Laetiporus sulphureus 93-53 TaxID=1314785 RepID=A0A165BST3_9APHY|nr:uncharacterized protein LAESUDRAFT_717375 [Laetiporus sulphureus 93-53]KZT01582.1 hypothetical protein LAESUDRAFT_717375 [Laetiporus sulphureus 93-53]
MFIYEMVDDHHLVVFIIHHLFFDDQGDIIIDILEADSADVEYHEESSSQTPDSPIDGDEGALIEDDEVASIAHDKPLSVEHDEEGSMFESVGFQWWKDSESEDSVEVEDERLRTADDAPLSMNMNAFILGPASCCLKTFSEPWDSYGFNLGNEAQNDIIHDDHYDEDHSEEPAEGAKGKGKERGSTLWRCTGYLLDM